MCSPIHCQEEGFGVFGCGVGEEGAPLYRRIEANVGLLKRPGSHSAFRDQFYGSLCKTMLYLMLQLWL